MQQTVQGSWFRAQDYILGATLLALAACGGDRGAAVGVVDDFGDTVKVAPANRIVSLNPVTTEFLFAAGAGKRVVGRTHWDHYPAAADSVPDLGNGIDPNVEAVIGARPDLVILYASESNRRATTALHKAGVRTLNIRTDLAADLTRFADAFARVTGDTTARAVADSVAKSLDAVRALPRNGAAPTMVWYMGEPPLFVAGKGSFMGELIEIVGARNVFGDMASPSPQVSIEEVVKRNPDYVVVGVEGEKNLRSSAAWQAVPAVKKGRLLVVDSAVVGRPGVRLGEAAHHLRGLLSAAKK